MWSVLNGNGQVETHRASGINSIPVVVARFEVRVVIAPLKL